MTYELKALRAKVQELKNRLETLSQHSGEVDKQLERLAGTPTNLARPEGAPHQGPAWPRMPPGRGSE